jgi:hypothetical protein
MAQTNFTPISLYYSTTAAAAPTAGNLVAGELAINTQDGKLFYKDASGVVQTIASKDANSGTFTSITDSGNLTFTGTGNRIRGDFSNATVSNRVAIQSSTTNGNTFVRTLPNGTATASALQAGNNSDPTNSAFIGIQADTEARLTSGINGTGTYLPLTMQTGGSERLRIDTSGNVGIGTSSPDNVANNTFLVVRNGSGAGGGIVKASSTGVDLRLQSTATEGYVGTFSNSILGLYTNSAERMRIDSSGALLIGGTSSPATTKLLARGPATVSECITAQETSGGGATRFYVGFYNSSNTKTGDITTNGTTTAYNTTSDYRLKTVIASVTDAGTRLDALKPIEYDWNTGGHAKGFLAHQFAEVYPNSVTGEKDAVDAEGKPVYQSMQASSAEVMADLIAEIQSLRKRVAQLESK